MLGTRKAFQNAMREELVAGVEEITGRRVIAFMSDNHLEPDMAIEAFVLEPLEAPARPVAVSNAPPPHAVARAAYGARRWLTRRQAARRLPRFSVTAFAMPGGCRLAVRGELDLETHAHPSRPPSPGTLAPVARCTSTSPT